MSSPPPTMLPPAPLIHSGKVRDSYQLDDGHLLMVSSDRLSAFDVVLPTAIPGKGIVLTQLSRFWFGQTAGLIGNHLTSRRVSDLGWSAELTDALEARSMIVRTAARIPVIWPDPDGVNTAKPVRSPVTRCRQV